MLNHYSCTVYLLCCLGPFSDAYDLIWLVPMEPNSGVWGAHLGSCKIYDKNELGKEVAERLFSLDPLDARNNIMLSNIYPVIFCNQTVERGFQNRVKSSEFWDFLLVLF